MEIFVRTLPGLITLKDMLQMTPLRFVGGAERTPPRVTTRS